MDEKYDKYALFRRGADDGLPFGAYLSVLFLFIVFSVQVPILGFLALLMMCGVPAWTYWKLRRAYTAERGTTRFSALWMQGIVMFFCGGLIMALVAYIYMGHINPTFIKEQMELMAEAHAGTPIGDTLATAIKNKIVPSPIQSAMELLWMSVFSGSLLSILTALLVQARRISRNNRR